MIEEWVWVPFEVERKYDGFRVDRFLSQRLVSYSRARVQKILEGARVRRGDQMVRASSKVRTGEKIVVAYLRTPEAALPADAALPVLYEDAHFLVVNKPADLLSHPTDKVRDHTVLGYLRHARPDIKGIHLLHRLDRETSGVLALGKDVTTARRWAQAMEARDIHKEYWAFVKGVPCPAAGVLDAPIGRQSHEIKVRQWVNTPDAVPAVTEFETVRVYNGATWIKAFPKTGRLHQIRVHLAAHGHPILGDPLYIEDGAAYLKLCRNQLTFEERLTLGFSRTALHAAAIRFVHPITKNPLHVQAPLPEDMQRYCDSAKLSV